MTTNTSSHASNAWKNILHCQSLLKKGPKWILGNENKTISWYDNWMDESPLTQTILPNTRNIINHQAKVVDYIKSNDHWNLSNLKDILLPPLRKSFSTLFP